ncbi:MAG: polysaccharide deacetylase family protein [Candidatus Margulisbacteria bacterium]|nr:polysaccharide deacetylase family protein [Candidatus Margulisiibacteriota bacterium]
MKNILKCFVWLLLFYAGSLFAAPQITVLSYHHLDYDPVKKTPYSVKSANFIEQMNTLKQAGFSFITLKQLDNYVYKNIAIPDHSLLVTFDDGNLNTYTIAYPILKKLKIPFVVFIYAGATTAGHRLRFANWEEIKEMSDNGVDIECHTYTHPILSIPPKTIKSAAAYEKWLDFELVDSRKKIEEKLGKPVQYLAIPFGAMDSVVYEQIKKSGYRMAFNVHGMNNNSLSDPFNYNRIMVMSTDSTKNVLAKAMENPVYFEDCHPVNLSRIFEQNQIIRFKLKNQQNYLAESVELYISGIKKKPVYNWGNGYYEMPYAFTRKQYYNLSVMARNKDNKKCRGDWIFQYNNEKPEFLN